MTAPLSANSKFIPQAYITEHMKLATINDNYPVWAK